ncbi:MAG: Flp pilus assembly protein CpaB [Actinomycetota bacterium]|nr:Flp pilus assembly protein CpaB [Actinomycetota bacterium]
MKRSNLIVALGLAVFVVGAAATYFFVKGDDDSQAAPAADEASVLYAAGAIPGGTTGSAALEKGMVKTKTVDAGAKPAGALTDPSQLVGKTAAGSIPEGSILTLDHFRQPQTSIGTLKIPEGKTALALQLGYIPGVAGFARAGDHIDIFGVIKTGGQEKAQLVMQNTEVLSVSAPAVAAGQPADINPVFLLAVTPPQAEKLVYLSTFQALHFSLVPRDQAPVPGTPGAALPDALKQLP